MRTRVFKLGDAVLFHHSLLRLFSYFYPVSPHPFWFPVLTLSEAPVSTWPGWLLCHGRVIAGGLMKGASQDSSLVSPRCTSDAWLHTDALPQTHTRAHNPSHLLCDDEVLEEKLPQLWSSLVELLYKDTAAAGVCARVLVCVRDVARSDKRRRLSVFPQLFIKSNRNSGVAIWKWVSSLMPADKVSHEMLIFSHSDASVI